ncbi:MAG: hypothetical protein ACK55I_05725, partial [bacterium]
LQNAIRQLLRVLHLNSRQLFVHQLSLLRAVAPHDADVVDQVSDRAAALHVELVRHAELVFTFAYVGDQVDVHAGVLSDRAHTVHEVLLAVVVIVAAHDLHH